MGNYIDREIDRGREIIHEIDDFIVRNDKGGRIIATRYDHLDNYFFHIERLLNAGQLMIQRNDKGEISAVCGWILTTKEHEHEINKITWVLPNEISNGDILYVSFSVIADGNIHLFRREFRKLLCDKVVEAFWFDAPAGWGSGIPSGP